MPNKHVILNTCAVRYEESFETNLYRTSLFSFGPPSHVAVVEIINDFHILIWIINLTELEISIRVIMELICIISTIITNI